MASTWSSILEKLNSHHHKIPDIDVSEVLQDMDHESLEKFRDNLKKILAFYKSENKTMDSTLQKLHVQRKYLRCETQSRLTKMSMWQDIFKTKNCNSIEISLSLANYLKKKNNYKYLFTRIRNSIKTYNNALPKIFMDTVTTQRYLEDLKEEVDDKISPSPGEIDELKVKIEMYTAQLKKYESDSSFLNEKIVSDWDKFGWEIDYLSYLNSLKKSITKELDRFQGLQPDLYEATKQLHEVECDFRQNWRQFLKNL